MKLIISASSREHGFHELDEEVWEWMRQWVQDVEQLLAAKLLGRNQLHDMNFRRERDVFLDRKEGKEKVLDLEGPSVSQWLKKI